jgi:hypothetical protein
MTSKNTFPGTWSACGVGAASDKNPQAEACATKIRVANLFEITPHFKPKTQAREIRRVIDSRA